MSVAVQAEKPIPAAKGEPRENEMRQNETRPSEPRQVNQVKKQPKVKLLADTVGISLRPARDLLNDYIVEAGERTKKEGRVISAQELMLEVLQRGRPKVKS